MPRYKDITGQRFGRLVAQYRQPWKKGGKSVWHCICDCGNECDIRLEQLTAPDDVKSRSKARSCGCLQKEHFTQPNRVFNYNQNYVGQIFDGIKILSQTEDKTNDRDLLHYCECLSCGEIFIAPGSEIAKKGTWHCPNCGKTISSGEKRIQLWLEEHNITFTSQKMFEDCKYIKPLPFDFAVINNFQLTLIEYDGEQHFKFVEAWHGNEAGFHNQQLRDNIKNNYCKTKGIKLLRIPYTEFNNIDIILSKEFLN